MVVVLPTPPFWLAMAMTRGSSRATGLAPFSNSVASTRMVGARCTGSSPVVAACLGVLDLVTGAAAAGTTSGIGTTSGVGVASGMGGASGIGATSVSGSGVTAGRGGRQQRCRWPRKGA